MRSQNWGDDTFSDILGGELTQCRKNTENVSFEFLAPKWAKKAPLVKMLIFGAKIQMFSFECSGFARNDAKCDFLMNF